LNYDRYDSLQGVNRISANIRQGVDFLDANDKGDLVSRANADSSFTSFSANMSRLQPLGSGWSVVVSAAGQYALDPLYSAEEFFLGGLAFGGAYDNAELSGDHGVAAKAEFRWDNVVNGTYLNDYQLYGFYDIGRVWNEDALASEVENASLASVGLGTRLGLMNGWRGNLEVAYPLTRDVAAEGSDGDDIRGFFSLSYDF
jgi:hemolysin activation/secretion protein